MPLNTSMWRTTSALRVRVGTRSFLFSSCLAIPANRVWGYMSWTIRFNKNASLNLHMKRPEYDCHCCACSCQLKYSLTLHNTTWMELLLLSYLRLQILVELAHSIALMNCVVIVPAAASKKVTQNHCVAAATLIWSTCFAIQSCRHTTRWSCHACHSLPPFRTTDGVSIAPARYLLHSGFGICNCQR